MIENCPNPFWKNILQIWNNFKKHFSEDAECRTFPIWGTFFMKNKNLTSRATGMVEKGLVYVNDLLSDTGNLLGYMDFIETFQIRINFVDYYSLTHSIPRQWLANCKRKLNHIEVKQGLLNSLLQQKKNEPMGLQKTEDSK